MKKTFYFFTLLVIFISFGSCKKLLTFTIAESAEIVIPATTLNTPITVPTPDVKTSSSQSFENNNTTADLVKDVRLKHVTLKIIDPSGQTFNFLKTIKVYISADGAPEKMLAWKVNIPNANTNTLDLDVTGEKLDDYIKKSKFSLRTKVVTDETTTQDVTIRAGMVFSVVADPF